MADRSTKRFARAAFALRQMTGRELTPDQFRDEVNDIRRWLRDQMRAKGHVVTDDDDAFDAMIRDALISQERIDYGDCSPSS